MSLISSIGKALRIGAGALISSTVPVVGPAIGTQIAQSAIPRPRAPTVNAMPGTGFMPAQFNPLMRLPAPPTRAPRALPALDLGVPGPGIFTPQGCPPGYHLAKDGSGRCVKNRRMNPMNPRAAKRAIRRIKAARKMLQQIERQLPKQRTTRRAVRHVPVRYSHRAE